MSPTTKTRKSASAARADGAAKTERARKAAIAEIQQRLKGKDDAKADGPLHEGTVTRGDGKVVKVTVPRDDKPEAAKGKPKGKSAKAAKAPKPPKAKKVSCLDAAAQILAGSDKPMKAKELIEAMAAKGLWTSPGGKTPESSLYAAMIREIGAKGAKARFAKAGKGLFAAGKGS